MTCDSASQARGILRAIHETTLTSIHLNNVGVCCPYLRDTVEKGKKKNHAVECKPLAAPATDREFRPPGIASTAGLRQHRPDLVPDQVCQGWPAGSWSSNLDSDWGGGSPRR